MNTISVSFRRRGERLWRNIHSSYYRWWWGYHFLVELSHWFINTTRVICHTCHWLYLTLLDIFPGQCCAFNVMPEHVMLRDKKKYASQEELKRWKWSFAFSKEKCCFQGGTIGTCRMATTTHPIRELRTAGMQRKRMNTKVEEDITGRGEQHQENLHMAFAQLRMEGQFGGMARRCQGGRSPPAFTWDSLSPSTPGSTRSSAPVSSHLGSRACCTCQYPSQRWLNMDLHSVQELKTFWTWTPKPFEQVDFFFGS